MTDRPTPPLSKAPQGYYRFETGISEEELKEYYANRYYQEGRGSYATSYGAEELDWFQLKANLVYREVVSLTGGGAAAGLLDVGCGEGWLMAEFQRQGWSVKGLDFSIAGISKCNPHLLPHFEQCDMFAWLAGTSGERLRYDVVSLMNVVEHAKDPVALLRSLHHFIKPGGMLVVVAPNDFSRLHDHLLAKGYVPGPWWVAFPDHLSYFNRESMSRLLLDTGYRVRTVVADNPIDLNLLNDNSNYIRDTSKGKSTHLFRVRVDNFLGAIDRDKLLALYEVLGSMGVGRNLIYYCRSEG